MQIQMFVRNGSRYRPAKGAEILEAAAYVQARKIESARPVMDSPDAVGSFLKGQLQHCAEEYFCVLFLDSRHRLISFQKMFRGTIDGCSVHPREVVRAALDAGAAAVVLAHNHPTGVSDPSQADELITRRLKEALALIDCRVLDHLIVGNDVFSFAQGGLL